MSDFEKREGEGALFTNDKMSSERSPVMTGYIMWEGKEIRIAGWGKTTQAGKKMLSLKAELAGSYEGATNGNSQSTGGHQNISTQGTGTPVAPVTGSGGEDVNDAIPF